MTTVIGQGAKTFSGNIEFCSNLASSSAKPTILEKAI
jgi:hypothetical protein